MRIYIFLFLYVSAFFSTNFISKAEAAVAPTLFIKNISYNANNQITRLELGNGTVTTQTFDSVMFRLKRINTINASAVVLQDLNYTYDPVGNIVSITDAKNTATQTFKYDHLNRLTQAVGGYGTYNYSYDTIGNVSTKEGVTFSYSKVNAGPHAVTSLSDGTTLTYDLNGNMATMNITGDNKTFTYDVENRLIDVTKNGTTVGQYFYDGDGGRTRKINYASAQAGNNTCFLAGTRIAMADGTTKSIEQIKVGDFVASFDEKNLTRTSAKVTELFDGDRTKEYLLINGTLKVTPNHKFYSKGQWIEIGKLKEGDLLFDEKGQEIPITKIEKITSQNSVQVYNLEVEGEHNYYANGILVHNKLSYNPPAVTGVSVSAGVMTNYVGSLAEETKGVWVNHIFLGSTKIATVSNNEVRFQFQDHLGGTNVVTNSSGAMIELIEYKPFGAFARRDQFGTSNAAWYYFTNKPLDEETGLMFYGARYYSPMLGRFITPDTVVQAPMNPQTLNRYSYCNNNPINLIDPDGHSWKSFWRKASQFVAIALGTAAGFINPYLGVAVYSAIAASGQGGNYMKNFAFNFASGVIGMQVGAFAGSMWVGDYTSGLAAAAFGGAAASASMAAFTGGDVGMAALAGFAGGAIGYTGGRVWQLGADAVAGGVASVIQGGDFGDGAANGAYSNMATTLGGMMAPMENLGDQDVQAGDAVMFKANSPGAALIGFLEGGIFTHAGTMVSKTELVEVGFWKTPAKITNINGVDNYAKRSAYVSTKFRGNQKVIGAALSMVNRDTVKSYGIGSGSKICSTACAASYSAGQKSWYGIDPNTQANVMGYNQFYISRAYGK